MVRKGLSSHIAVEAILMDSETFLECGVAVTANRFQSLNEVDFLWPGKPARVRGFKGGCQRSPCISEQRKRDIRVCREEAGLDLDETQEVSITIAGQRQTD